MKKVLIIAIPIEAGPDGGIETEPLQEVLARIYAEEEGSFSFAMVPRPEAIRFLNDCQFSFPLHLVAPRESMWEEEGTSNATENLKIASVNVQPGRGATEADWSDCEVWLDTVADYDLVISEDGEVPATSELERPTWVIGPEGIGKLSKPDPPTDEETKEEVRDGFEEVKRDVFGKKEIPDSMAEIKAAGRDVSARHAPWFRFLETGSLFLNLSPGIILAIAAVFCWESDQKAIGKFSAALLAALAAFGLSRHRSRRRWLSARTLSEVCRSLQHSSGILDPLFPPTAHHLPGHARLARTLAIHLAEKEQEDAESVIAFRDNYIYERLEKERGGQIPYFSTQSKRALRRRRIVKTLFQVATLLSLAATATALGLVIVQKPEWEAFNKQWIAGFATF
ncbi:MAG: hypothetical protein AAF491_09410, partial [Verrucomicrobiota bacterium]